MTVKSYEELDQIECEFREAIIQLARTHNLTRAETLDIITRVFSQRMLISTKYMLREERGE